jgi:hypothetical protein
VGKPQFLTRCRVEAVEEVVAVVVVGGVEVVVVAEAVEGVDSRQWKRP